MDEIWNKMYEAAKAVQGKRTVSDFVEVGEIAAAVLAGSGRIYTGICVDTACTLGICAERNAIFSMISQGEGEIRRVLAIQSDGSAVPPCGACRELMVQMMPEHYREIEILLDWQKKRVMTLAELTPEWWV